MHKTIDGLSANTLDALRDFFHMQAIEEKRFGKRHVRHLNHAHLIVVTAGQLFDKEKVFSAPDIVWIHDLARSIAFNVPDRQIAPSPIEMNPLMLFIQGCTKIS